VSDDDDDSEAAERSTVNARASNHRRRDSPAADSDGYVEDGSAIQAGDAGGGGVNHEQLVKKFVRYALACEYARQPIRRQEVNTKGLARILYLRECWRGQADRLGDSYGEPCKTIQDRVRRGAITTAVCVWDGDDGAAGEGEGDVSSTTRFVMMGHSFCA
jgi:hypothetical protein